jgi:uncharacterized surface protein with fasciclin (FAS1) repeats
MYVPTDDVFRAFVDEILTSKSGFPHWPDLQSLPRDIVQIIVDHHFFDHPVYSTHISEGLRDGDRNLFFMNEEDIIRKEFGSNCTFIGLKEHIPSRVFTSVTGPVFLRPYFSIFRYAMQYSGAVRRITNKWDELAFFPVTDAALTNDSSLILEWVSYRNNEYRFWAYNRDMKKMDHMSSHVLRNRILDQVGTSCPDGSADKEFIRTLRGNYIIWNNAENTVQGSLPNTFGYEGTSTIITHPTPLGEPTDNGKTWAVNAWFNYDLPHLQTVFLNYPAFRNLLLKAGLLGSQTSGPEFLEEARFMTVFIPSDQALAGYQVDTLSVGELEDFLRYHFVQDELIFTDNKSDPGEYLTLRKDPTSPPSYSDYLTLNIRPGPDLIEILDSQGIPYVTVHEAGQTTNIMASTNYSEINAVIHEIDKVLIWP